jgi:DNA-binding MarR family transcriptional regulator
VEKDTMNNCHEKTPVCYVYLLSKAYQKGHNLVQNHLKAFGLTNMQYVVLECLWHSERLTLSETGKQLSIDKATLSGVIERMAESGWIRKEKDPKDKRIYRLFPSEKSIELKEQLVDERVKANDKLLSSFTPQEKILLRKLLLAML